MSSSTSIRGVAGRRVGILLLGLALACVGALSFANSQAKAEAFSMDFDAGQVNLGFAFKGAEILPASQTLGATPLPDLWDARDTITLPGAPPAGTNANPTSFAPVGCLSPVTFGLYAALQLDGDGNPIPGGLVQDPRPSGVPFGGLLVQPLANAGAASDPAGGRTLAAGAIVPEGQTIGSINGPYPATAIKWVPLSVAALPPTSAPVGPGTQGPTANPSNPCDANPAAATVSGEIDGENNITIEPNDFRFPIMIVPNPLDGSPVPITLATTGNLTGELTPEGGLNLLDLEGPIEVRVLTGLASNPLGTYCSLPLPNRQADGTGSGPLKLTSGASLPVAVGFNGTPFESLSGPGALTGTWLVENDSVSVGGADCATVNSVSKGLGGIWLGAGIEDPAPFPTCADEGKTGTWPNCNDVPPLTPAKIGSVKVAGPSKAKRGKVASYKVTIANSGETAATGVRLKASGRGVSLNTSVGSVAGEKSRTVTVKVRFRSKGKVKAKFVVTSANAGSKSATRTITVR